MSEDPKKSKFMSVLSFIFQLITKKMQSIIIESIPIGSLIDVGGGEGIIAQIGGEELQL